MAAPNIKPLGSSPPSWETIKSKLLFFSSIFFCSLRTCIRVQFPDCSHHTHTGVECYWNSPRFASHSRQQNNNDNEWQQRSFCVWSSLRQKSATDEGAVTTGGGLERGWGKLPICIFTYDRASKSSKHETRQDWSKRGRARDSFGVMLHTARASHAKSTLHIG